MDTEAALLCKEGKDNYLNADGDEKKRSLGISQLEKARRMGDPDAAFFLGEQILAGRLSIPGEDRMESAMRLLFEAEYGGSLQARALINRVCDLRYKKTISYDPAEPHPLTGFDGEPILIDLTGRKYPVDCVLSFTGKTNVLTLSANIDFMELDDSPGFKRYTDAVLAGIRDWAGDYTVFGGQPVTVKLELTTETRLSDSVHVVRVDSEMGDLIVKTRKFVTMGRDKRVSNIVKNGRAFALTGVRNWSTRSFKFIYMLTPSGTFDDPEELRFIARHEFGHVLGLGDLYASESDGYEGLEPRSYPELDCFHMFGKHYRAVMCSDPYAAVSNNDIEMVIMAFSKNKIQNFQENGLGEISEALGKGN